MKFWTSEKLVEKCSKRPRDPLNRIRLEKLCPKVVSDCQNAGRMTSKRRFWHFRPTIENPGQNVHFPPQPWGHSTPNSTICFGQRVILRSIKWQGQADFYPGIKRGDVPEGGILVEIVENGSKQPTNASKGYSGPVSYTHLTLPTIPLV